MDSSICQQKKPDWLKAKAPQGKVFLETQQLVRAHSVNTVCQSAQCPNMGECWSRKTATLMILGKICTRNCSFCGIQKGHPLTPDPTEPEKVAASILNMELQHAVVTSVTRDDLIDGGASIWALTIRAIRKHNPHTTIEVLVPDFRGNKDHLQLILAEKPEIFNHNLEVVERLQQPIRKTARYDCSLAVLQQASDYGLVTKSGLMLGLGETLEEIRKTIQDLRAVGCQMLTLGQYLQPSKQHHPVVRWVPPTEFNELKTFALSQGFRSVQSGPLVRSSYLARV